jgi:hypothetical protein
MGLYLTIFDDNDEIDGVEVGSYSDFSYIRNIIVDRLENGVAGSRFPTLMLHSDCDGEWSHEEASNLELELNIIKKEFVKLPTVPYNSEWQNDVAKTFGIKPKNLFECFFDVDGEPLLERILELSKLSQELKLPILFQ